MYLMRGLPGSGKTAIAQEILIIYGNDASICSADDYRVNNEGTYEWKRSQYEQTHELCLEKARNLCESAMNVVIIGKSIFLFLTLFWLGGNFAPPPSRFF